MEFIEVINYTVAIIFFLCYSYQFVYIPLAHLRHKSALTAQPAGNTFAVLICARNEEKVITELIESLKSQTYDGELTSIFVMADNCTDGTALAARQAGAIVYERFNQQLVGKGYALDQLMAFIARDYPDGYDGYFVFDADNILEPDYIEQMNVTFSSGYEIVTSYRNSKNYGDNWISAGYGLWFMRESKYLNNARMNLGFSAAVSGTGFLFSRAILDSTGGGWPFHLLTEDIEFTVHHILRGVKIGYCPNAVFYDEQPVTMRQSWTQRMRWAKGYLQVFGKYGRRLMSGAARGNFSCFDMCMAIMPAIVLTAVSVLCNLFIGIVGIGMGTPIWPAIVSMSQSMLNMYLMLLAIGLITTVTQWKRIHVSPLKKLGYCFSFPIFMLTYIPISFSAIFAKVEWKPIEHRVSVSVAEAKNRL